MADRRPYNQPDADDRSDVEILADAVSDSLTFSVEALRRIKMLELKIAQLESDVSNRSRLILPP